MKNFLFHTQSINKPELFYRIIPCLLSASAFKSLFQLYPNRNIWSTFYLIPTSIRSGMPSVFCFTTGAVGTVSSHRGL